MASSTVYVLAVRSSTSALRGQRILESKGIPAAIQRSSSPASQNGCGYAIKIVGDLSNAVRILNSEGVEVVEIRR